MVLVEHLPCSVEVEVVLGADRPGDVEHSLDPGPDPTRLHALVPLALEAVHLLVGRGPHVVW